MLLRADRNQLFRILDPVPVIVVQRQPPRIIDIQDGKGRARKRSLHAEPARDTAGELAFAGAQMALQRQYITRFQIWRDMPSDFPGLFRRMTDRAVRNERVRDRGSYFHIAVDLRFQGRHVLKCLNPPQILEQDQRHILSVQIAFISGQPGFHRRRGAVIGGRACSDIGHARPHDAVFSYQDAGINAVLRQSRCFHP